MTPEERAWAAMERCDHDEAATCHACIAAAIRAAVEECAEIAEFASATEFACTDGERRTAREMAFRIAQAIRARGIKP